MRYAVFSLFKLMKITGTRIIEQKLVNLFYLSKNEVNKEKYIEAQTMVKNIIKIFRLIGIFDGINHDEIAKKLYFTKNNILVIGVKKMAAQLYMDEKTLYKLRKKYCAVISEAIEAF